MAIHPSFPSSPYEELKPEFRWFPADEALRESSYEKLLPPLVHKIRKVVQQWRNTRYKVAQVKDRYDLIRYDSSGAVSSGMFDEDWLRLVIKMATGSGKTKVMSLFITWCYFHKIDELIVINDETHHIHDPRLAWFKSNQDIHNRLKHKDQYLSLQIDVTATPKHNNGAIFVQTVCDYPLVEAITPNVVKHPVLPDSASRAKLAERQSSRYTEKYADYIALGVEEWRKSYSEHEKLGKKAVLFIMTDDTKNCDDVAEYLE